MNYPTISPYSYPRQTATSNRQPPKFSGDGVIHMLRKLDHQSMGGAEFDWLSTVYHFSFADYFDETKINFGVLRVLNDNLISPHSVYKTTTNNNIETLTYVVDGELTYTDQHGHNCVLKRGQMHYMSAASDVEQIRSNNTAQPTRVLEIGISPQPHHRHQTHGDYHFDFEARHNQWLHMVSDIHGDAPITINQDVNIYTIILDEKNTATINVPLGRQAYLMQIEGFSEANGIALKEQDALEIIEDEIHIAATHTSHFIVIEMPKSSHPYM